MGSTDILEPAKNLIDLLQSQNLCKENEDTGIENIDDPFQIFNIKNNYIDPDDFKDEIGNDTQHSLKIIHINIHSLADKFDRLKILLTKIKSQIDIILLCETFLNENNSENYNLKGYNFIYKNRSNRTKGGVGMYIKNYINYKLRDDISIFEEGIFESIFIETTNKNQEAIIGEIYRIPNTNEKDSIDKYEKIISKTSNINKLTIIGTDQNFDYLKIDQHKTTQELLDAFFINTFIPTIVKPTRITHSTATLIDNIYVKCNVSNNITSGIIMTDLSDHLPIFTCIGTSKPDKKSPHKTKTRQINETAINNIKYHLKQINWTQLHDMDTNKAFEFFIETLNNILDTYAPEREITVKPNNMIREKWMTKGLLKSSKTCEKLYKSAINLPKTNQKHLEYIKYRNLYNKIRRLAKSQYYGKLLNESRNDIKETWKIMKNAMNKTTDKTSTIQTIKHKDKTWDTESDIANAFCDYFTNVGLSFAQKISKSKKDYTQFMGNATPNSIFLNPTDTEEILNIFKNLKPKTSSGHDNINAKLLKEIQQEIKDPLCTLLNKSLENGIFPNIFKIAEVIPIYKNKGKEKVENYRPISLLPTISKILEKIIHKRIYKFLQKHKTLYNSQYGFRPEHSTVNAITEYTIQLIENLENKKHTLSTYLDLSKAFDTIDHSILLNKLKHYGIRGNCLTWLTSYLTNRTQYVKINKTKSGTQKVICGVPQGSVLGPLLFIIYTNDIPNLLKQTHTILFADDTTIYASDTNLNSLYNKVNHDLEILCDWFKANKLSLNIAKTNYMLFTNTPSSQHNPQQNFIKIGNDTITRQQQVKFLGITIDDKLDWHGQIHACKNKISKTLYCLRSLKNTLPKQHLRTLYQTLIQPHLEYGIEIWGATHETHINKLNIIQKKAIRVITNAKYNQHTLPLFRELKLLKLKDLHQLKLGKFMYKATHNQLPLPLQPYFPQNTEIHSYSTRQSSSTHIRHRRTAIASIQINYKGPEHWNVLSNDIKEAKTLKLLTQKLKRNLINKY